MRCAKATLASSCLKADGLFCTECNARKGWVNLIFTFGGFENYITGEFQEKILINECFHDYDIEQAEEIYDQNDNIIQLYK